MFRFLFVLSGLTLLVGCAPPSPADLELYPEKAVRPDIRDQFKHRMHYLGKEQPWHAKCFFGKPLNWLTPEDMVLNLPVADLLFRAHWEEQRLLYHNAGYLYRQAANKGAPFALARLGHLLVEGQGTDPNPDGGAQLIWQSAQLGCAEGQYFYADLLTRGVGVRADLLSAWSWSKTAQEQGYDAALALYEKITALLGPAQLELAQQRHAEIQKQLHLFNDPYSSRQLVNCKLPYEDTPFPVGRRQCVAMGGDEIAPEDMP